VNSLPGSKARRVYQALLRIGWRRKPGKGGSHVQREREGYREFTWAWHDSVETGPIALKKIAKYTGLKPKDL